MYGYIYKTTNLINNKIYIGQKKSKVFLNEKYLGSGKYLWHAINKYGKDNFIVEMLDTAETRDELSELEIFYISTYNSTDPKIGYNIARGGIGGGEVYVNNGIKNEFIMKSNLQRYLQEGWTLGLLPGRKEKNHSLTRGLNISKALKGRPKSKLHIEHHRESLKAKKRHWYTNGVVGQDICIEEGKEIPENYYPGRTISDEVKKRCGAKNIGKTPWNKGLTKQTDERVKRYAESLKK